MPIREFFHLIHVVDDIAEVDSWYDALFAPQRFMFQQWSDVEKRTASLAMIGDFMIEVVEPSTRPGDEGAPLPKFAKRFGRHFHSLSWYVDVPDFQPLFERLRAHGIRVAKPGGGLFPDGAVDAGQTIFTHPKDTFGQLEFVTLGDTWRARDPRFAGPWAPAWWRDEHPLGIARVSHFTTLVADLGRARAFYVGVLDARVLHESTDGDGASVFVFVGSETVVELRCPAPPSPSRPARDLAANGELPHGVTFTVRDLDRAERHAEQVGVGIAERGSDSFTLDPGDCFGAVYTFTETPVPGDPRA